MTEPPPKSASSNGPILLLIVLLVDVGLIIWGWHLWQQKQARLDDAGLSLRKAPQTEQSRWRPPTEADKIRTPNTLDFVVPEDPNAPARRPGAGSAARTVPAMPEEDGERRGRVRRATLAFFELKHAPRFKNSKVIQEWKSDFLAYPDLKQINDDYRQDADAIRFLVRMTRSPSFGELVKKHLQKDDLRAFIKEIAAKPEVRASMADFTADANVAAAVDHLGLKAGTAQDPAPAAPQRPRLSDNPALQKYFDQAEETGVSLE